MITQLAALVPLGASGFRRAVTIGKSQCETLGARSYDVTVTKDVLVEFLNFATEEPVSLAARRFRKGYGGVAGNRHDYFGKRIRQRNPSWKSLDDGVVADNESLLA